MRRKPAPRAFPGLAAGCATLVGVSSVLVSAVEPEADMPGVMVVPAELGGLGVACLRAERDGGRRMSQVMFVRERDDVEGAEIRA